MPSPVSPTSLRTAQGRTVSSSTATSLCHRVQCPEGSLLQQQLSSPFSMWGLRGIHVPGHVHLSQCHWHLGEAHRHPASFGLNLIPPLSRRRGPGVPTSSPRSWPCQLRGDGPPGRDVTSCNVRSPQWWHWLCPLPHRAKGMWLDTCSCASPAPAVPLSCPRTMEFGTHTGVARATIPIPWKQTVVASLARTDPIVPTAC